MDLNELFWGASLKEMSKGYILREEKVTCLLCGMEYLEGVIYPCGDLLLEAKRAVQNHIAQEHGSVFEFLMGLGKGSTGLTEQQKELLALFYQKASDKEVAGRLGIGASTVRNHRFKLRERKRQAQVFLALMELLEQENPVDHDLVSVHRGARMVDDRYAVTQEEREKIISRYMRSDGTMIEWPSREKRKVILLTEIVKRFERGREYNELEVNAVLKTIYEEDYVVLRRYLIEYGYLERVADGSRYWVKA